MPETDLSTGFRDRWKDCRFGINLDACASPPKRIISFKDPHMTTKSRLLLALPLLLFVSSGCAPKNPTPSSLSGTVKYNGNPVTSGTISVYPTEGGFHSIVIQSDGTYSSAGLPVGEITVAIETESANPKNHPPQDANARRRAASASPAPGGERPGTGAAGGGAAAGGGGPYVKIPTKYAKKETSGLTYTIIAGPNQKDWELTD
jgi:hypothetical protein